jgi:hypothetical protein
MGRCFGVTRNLNRCGRIGDWRLFCTEHKKQPVIWLFVLVFTVIAGTASILSYVSQQTTPQNTNADGSEVPRQLSYSAGDVDIALNSKVGFYRIRYLQLNEYGAFESLLKGQVAEKYPKLFDKEPYVIRTEAFDLLNRLESKLKDYRGGLESQTFHFSQIKRKFETDPNYFIKDPRYSRFAEDECPSTVDYALGFVGAENVENLAGNYEPFSQLFRDLLLANPQIPDLAIERLVLGECECEWNLSFWYRPLKMVICDIENLDQKPLKLESLEVSLEQFPDLQVNTLLDITGKTGEIRQIEFPPGWLKPGEHILIPMGFILSSFVDRNVSPHPESIPGDLPEATFILSEKQTIAVPEKTRTVKYHNEYVMGPWLKPQRVGELNTIRPFSHSSVVYLGSLEQGSCPYVYVYVKSSRKWIKGGTLISNLEGKENERESRLPIPTDIDGRILIRELERETSYLDQVYLTVELQDGTHTIIYPKNEDLRLHDSTYLVLTQGQELLLEFSLPKAEIKTIQIISRGYFVMESEN